MRRSWTRLVMGRCLLHTQHGNLTMIRVLRLHLHLHLLQLQRTCQHPPLQRRILDLHHRQRIRRHRAGSARCLQTWTVMTILLQPQLLLQGAIIITVPQRHLHRKMMTMHQLLCRARAHLHLHTIISRLRSLPLTLAARMEVLQPLHPGHLSQNPPSRPTPLMTSIRAV